jgi:S-adenosylmethionine hydrolase
LTGPTSAPTELARAAPAVPSGIVTLTTDFGLSDPFVGVMTGAVLRRFPGARIVQLCHGIAPQDTCEAAFWLERAYGWFTPGSVHVAVVDPAVGTERAVLAAAIDGHWFVVPDAGLLGPRLLSQPDARVVAVRWERLGLPRPSATFHGRDVLAPVAALLASGEMTLADLGPETPPRPSQLPLATRGDAGARGEVVVVDRFGNLISNVDGDGLPEGALVEIAGRVLRLARTYADAPTGGLVALVNAFGTVEVAVRDGSARDSLGIGRGTPLAIRPPPDPA